MKKVIMIAVISGVLCMLAVMSFAGNASFLIQEGVTNGIRHISGGIGIDERQEMKKMTKDYNLQLVFGVASGKYLADIDVTIIDSNNNTILQTISVGPWFFVDLPAGRYKINASNDGEAKTHNVKVGKGRSRVVFFWKE